MALSSISDIMVDNRFFVDAHLDSGIAVDYKGVLVIQGSFDKCFYAK